MAQVTVKINGFAYNVGCEDGHEPHLLAMGGEVENRIESIKALGGNSGETKLLVLAALLMADELHDLKIELESLRTAAARAAKRVAAVEAKGGPASDPDISRRLGRIAARAEQLAAGMEQPTPPPT